MKPCNNCLAPLPDNGTDSRTCDLCRDIQGDLYKFLQASPIFAEELDCFLENRKKVLFAYSGGLDSTVVLHKLHQECKKRIIELLCFTLDHGYKGDQAHKNIGNVIRFEGLENQHKRIDIQDQETHGKKNIEQYSECIQHNILPCGPLCNKIVDLNYKEILNQHDEDILITGGDTPKFNKKLGRYSILREKPEFTVLRGGTAFGMNKQSNQAYIKDNSIPWDNPGCGGYDTDCMIPGTILRNLIDKNTYSYDDICSYFPQIIGYLSERVRRGIIDKEDAIKKIEKIDIANDASYTEALKIAKPR
ncbi:MAG: ATP-binding protein [Candidatus Absconditabacterales bacterium]